MHRRARVFSASAATLARLPGKRLDQFTGKEDSGDLQSYHYEAGNSLGSIQRLYQVTAQSSICLPSKNTSHVHECTAQAAFLETHTRLTEDQDKRDAAREYAFPNRKSAITKGPRQVQCDDEKYSDANTSCVFDAPICIQQCQLYHHGMTMDMKLKAGVSATAENQKTLRQVAARSAKHQTPS
eukprot:6040979-Amphidinium_carterae.1